MTRWDDDHVERYSPSVRRRRLGRALRKLRDAKGMTSEAAGKAVGIDQSTLSKFETADRNVSRAVLIALMSIYEADKRTQDELLALHATAKEKGWFQPYGVQPGAYVDWESEATKVQDFEPLLIPGILQTPAYAEEVIAASQPDMSDEERAQWAATRKARAELLDDLGDTQLWYIVGEAALRTQVGGLEVMRDQVGHILNTIKNVPGLTVQVLPYEAGAHMAMTGAFSILTFADLPPLGAVEHVISTAWFERTADLNVLTTAFGRLSAQALSPKESRQWLEKL
jgi:transcriptional regulator with XRE-family HTH domain